MSPRGGKRDKIEVDREQDQILIRHESDEIYVLAVEKIAEDAVMNRMAETVSSAEAMVISVLFL